MKVEDSQTDRLKQAFQALETRLQGNEPCPSAEQIWDAQKGLLSAEQTHNIIDHTSRCGSCAEEWRLAEALMPQDADSGKTGGKLVRFPVLVPAAALVVAAVLVLAFGLQFSGSQNIPPAEVTYRDPGASSQIVSLIASGASLPRDAFALKWDHQGKGNITYDLKVQTESLEEVLMVSRLEQSEYLLDSSTLEGLPSGTKLLWQVVVRIDGEQVKLSPTFMTTLQ